MALSHICVRKRGLLLLSLTCIDRYERLHEAEPTLSLRRLLIGTEAMPMRRLTLFALALAAMVFPSLALASHALGRIGSVDPRRK